MIDDPDDPRVADYRHLTDADLRRAYEGSAGVFIVEGHLAIARLVTSSYTVRSFLVTAARLAVLEEVLGEAPPVAAPVHVVSAEVMAFVAGFEVHRGLLAAADRQPLRSVADVAAAARVVAVLEGINDHENMGALFRNAAAFSVNAVVLDAQCCDPLYRRSVRVSMGHVLHVPHTVAGDWPEALGQLGFRTVALTPDPAALSIDEFSDDGRPLALMFGAEGHGLSDRAMAQADVRVRIPIAPDVDSLNVATAAAIAFHHVGKFSSGRPV